MSSSVVFVMLFKVVRSRCCSLRINQAPVWSLWVVPDADGFVPFDDVALGSLQGLEDPDLWTSTEGDKFVIAINEFWNTDQSQRNIYRVWCPWRVAEKLAVIIL